MRLRKCGEVAKVARVTLSTPATPHWSCVCVGLRSCGRVAKLTKCYKASHGMMDPLATLQGLGTRMAGRVLGLASVAGTRSLSLQGLVAETQSLGVTFSKAYRLALAREACHGVAGT